MINVRGLFVSWGDTSGPGNVILADEPDDPRNVRAADPAGQSERTGMINVRGLFVSWGDTRGPGNVILADEPDDR